MKLYNTQRGTLLEYEGAFWVLEEPWDSLINRDQLDNYLMSLLPQGKKLEADQLSAWLDERIRLPPIGHQEVWAAGVTYLRSRDARMEESQTSGASTLYDRVYEAARPELFFKATPQRVSGHGQLVYIRQDSEWNVPEPELTLFINSMGQVQGYTVGNDMSSRSIEGDNALYLPQAKIYERSAALGPCLWVTSQPISAETLIKMTIARQGQIVFADETALSRMKRAFTELTAYLFRECDFPDGCFLMTGTCLVPPATFTLQEGDVVNITIDGIGTLVNTIGIHPKHRLRN